MKRILFMSWMLWMAVPAMGETISFSQQQPGTLPAGWVCGVTGRGAPKWAIEAERAQP